MDKSKNKIWKNSLVNLDNENETIDFAGVLVSKNECWNIDHIYPKNGFNNSKKCGTDCYENLQVCSFETNKQKANKNNGTIKIKYKDLNIFTEYEIHKNIFINKSNVGIVYVKSQYNDINNIKEENFYFYQGVAFKKNKNDELLAYLVDFEESAKNCQIILTNYYMVLEKTNNNKWKFTKEDKQKLFSNYLLSRGGFKPSNFTNTNNKRKTKLTASECLANAGLSHIKK